MKEKSSCTKVICFFTKGFGFCNPFKIMDWVNNTPGNHIIFKSFFLLRPKLMQQIAIVFCFIIALLFFFLYSSIISIFMLKYSKIFAFIIMLFLIYFTCYSAGTIISRKFMKNYQAVFKRAVKYFCILFLSLFLFGFVCYTFVNSSLLHRICYNIEFPFFSLEGIAIDSRGNLYCGHPFFNRVQVYDKHGKFISGWFTRLTHTSFNIDIDSNNNIRVAKNKIDEIYNSKGDLLSVNKKAIAEYDAEYGELIDLMEQGFSGDYFLLKGFPLNKINRIDSSGNKTTFVRDPIYVWLDDMTLPAFLCVLLFFLVDILLRRSGNYRLRTWFSKIHSQR